MKKYLFIAALLAASVAQAQAVTIRSSKSTTMLDVVTNGVDAGSGGATNGLMCMGTDGTLARSVSVDTSGRSVVIGSKTNNAAAPGATNVGALPAVATAALASYTEGYLVALSTDLTGALMVATQCSSRVHANTVVGVDAGSTPASQLAGRRYVTLCNSLQNSGTPLVKCRVDGTNPVMAATNAGDVLGLGDCIQYDVAASVVPACISDAAGTNVTSYECL